MDKSSKTLFVIFRREVSSPSLLHQSPSLEAIVRKPARRQDGRLGDELLEFAPPIAERTAAQISCPDPDRIEGDVGGGRYCDVGGRGIVQEMEPADEVRIEHRHFSINDCRPRGKLGHGASDVGEAGRVVLAGPTHQANVAAFLDGDNAPAVHLLLDTHPSRWKGLARAGAIGGNQCQDVEGDTAGQHAPARDGQARGRGRTVRSWSTATWSSVAARGKTREQPRLCDVPQGLTGPQLLDGGGGGGGTAGGAKGTQIHL